MAAAGSRQASTAAHELLDARSRGRARRRGAEQGASRGCSCSDAGHLIGRRAIVSVSDLSFFVSSLSRQESKTQSASRSKRARALEAPPVAIFWIEVHGAREARALAWASSAPEKEKNSAAKEKTNFRHSFFLHRLSFPPKHLAQQHKLAQWVRRSMRGYKRERDSKNGDGDRGLELSASSGNSRVSLSLSSMIAAVVVGVCCQNRHAFSRCSGAVPQLICFVLRRDGNSPLLAEHDAHRSGSSERELGRFSFQASFCTAAAADERKQGNRSVSLSRLRRSSFSNHWRLSGNSRSRAPCREH